MRASFLAFIICSLVTTAAGQATDPRVVTPGVPLADELTAGQSRTYAVALDAGQFVSVAIRKTPHHPVITVVDPAGRTVVQSTWGEASLIAETSGRHLVRARVDGTATAPGRFEIVVEPPRTPNATDTARAAGDKAITEGSQLATQTGTASLRSAVVAFDAALVSYREAGYRSGRLAALLEIGQYARQIPNEAPKARAQLDAALTLARAAGDRAREADALQVLGLTFTRPSERATALEHYRQALAIFEALDDVSGSAFALNNMAAACNDLGEYQQALDYFARALPLPSIGDRGHVARIYNNRGQTLLKLGNLSEALDHFRRAQTLTPSTGSPTVTRLMALFNMGLVYKEMGEYAKARDVYTQSLTGFRALGQSSREAQVLNAIGNIYRSEGDEAKALEFYENALQIARRIDQPFVEGQVPTTWGPRMRRWGTIGARSITISSRARCGARAAIAAARRRRSIEPASRRTSWATWRARARRFANRSACGGS